MRNRLIGIGALSLVVCGVALSGCATTNSSLASREAFVVDHPDLSEVQADAILEGRVMLGMNGEMVTAAWGDPTRVEMVKAEDANFQWIYGNVFVGGSITNLFFNEDGLLVRYEVAGDQVGANSQKNSNFADGGSEALATPTVSKSGSVGGP